MATGLRYTTEQLNYYRICYVVTDILTEGLRTIFKQEWDNRYKTTLGEWKDQPKNGMHFWSGESTRNRKRNAGLLTTMKNGDRAEWDCTMLFYAILYSDCIYSLNPSIRSNVDDLRKFRNEEFAHMRRGHLSNGDFQNVITKVKTAFHALGLPTLKINEVQNQTNFLTEELDEVLRKVDDLKQEVNKKEKELLEKDKELLEKGTKLEEKLEEIQEKGKELQQKEEQRLALEEQLHSDVSPFCILPPKPSHDIAPRESEVGEVLQNLQTLKDANDGLSILYLSGNPGSGKSQLARLAAKRFYDEVEQIPSAASFVMTLNAENSEALLKSYVLFAQHCKCPGYEIKNTYRSKDLNTDEKISYFKTLISTKIEHYTSWLLVVDNMTSLFRTSDHLPDAGNELWARGQMLITTQDTSMLLSSSSIRNISLSAGMHPDDACFLLNLLTGTTDVKIVKETAKVLDYQPLALAGAATYVRQVRQNKATSKFGWTDYLKKLEIGKRSATENILAETNPSYSKSMTKAITLAVEKAMADDIIWHRTFLFLSMCASQPILQDIITEYIKAIDDDFEDEDMIRTRMSRCSLLLIEEESAGVYIRVHGVVLDVIKSATKGFAKDQSYKVVYGAVMSFSKFEELEAIFVGTRIVPHLQTLSLKIEDMSLGKGIPEATERALCNFLDGLWSLNYMCLSHGEFRAALVYGKCLLKIQIKQLGPEHVGVARCYNNLGTLHSELGDTDEAKNCYTRALEIMIKQLGPEHVNVARCYNNLGTVYKALGDTDKARDCYTCALEIRLKKLGPEHVDVARCYNNLGTVYKALGDTHIAKDCYKRALEIRLKKLGPDHVDVASSYNNLGTLHSYLGDIDEAKDCYKRALEIKMKQLGPEHVDVARCYNNLGSLHEALGDTDEAKDCYTRALEIRLKQLGPEHVDVASSYNNLGTLYSDLGDIDEAKDCYKRAIGVRMKKLGPEHVDPAQIPPGIAISEDDFPVGTNYIAEVTNEENLRENQVGPNDGNEGDCSPNGFEAKGIFDSSGGELSATNDSDVKICIANGAIPIGVSQEVFYRVVYDTTELLQDIPVRPDETLISPVIECGPHDIRLLKPSEIIIPHCLYMGKAKKEWITVYRTDPGPIKWEKIPNKSKRNDLSRAWFTAKEDSIHINTMTFCFWCVYFRRGAPKRKRATVFASKPNPGGDLIQFRFYIYSDNKDSLRRVETQDKELFPHSWKGMEKPFKMYNNSKKITVKLLPDPKKGWELDETAGEQVYICDDSHGGRFRCKDACVFAVEPMKGREVKPFTCKLTFQQEGYETAHTIYVNPGYPLVEGSIEPANARAHSNSAAGCSTSSALEESDRSNIDEQPKTPQGLNKSQLVNFPRQRYRKSDGLAVTLSTLRRSKSASGCSKSPTSEEGDRGNLDEQSKTRQDSKPLSSLLEIRPLLEKICNRLDSSRPGVGDYRDVCSHYGIDSFQVTAVYEKHTDGPSKALLEHLAASHEQLTVAEFESVLRKIAGRSDIAKLLEEYDNQ